MPEVAARSMWMHRPLPDYPPPHYSYLTTLVSLLATNSCVFVCSIFSRLPELSGSRVAKARSVRNHTPSFPFFRRPYSLFFPLANQGRLITCPWFPIQPTLLRFLRYASKSSSASRRRKRSISFHNNPPSCCCFQPSSASCWQKLVSSAVSHLI